MRRLRPETRAAWNLLAHRDYHEPSCPKWTNVGERKAPCTCELPKAVARVERESQARVAKHVPEVKGHCDSGIFLGCSCGWDNGESSNHVQRTWQDHLTVYLELEMVA